MDSVVLIFGGMMAVIFGLITSNIARNKGYYGGGWFFCGFFLGIIGIIIAAAQPDIKSMKKILQERPKKESDEISKLREYKKFIRLAKEGKYNEVSTVRR